MTWKISQTQSFRTYFKNLPKNIQKDAIPVIESLVDDPWQDFLRTHPLRHPLDGYSSCSIDADYRIVMRLSEKKGEIVLWAVGKHDVYDDYARWMNLKQRIKDSESSGISDFTI